MSQRAREPEEGVTPSTALRLAQFFGTSAAFWLNLQLRLDLCHAGLAEAAELKRIEAPETATLRPGIPVRVASELAVLSVRTAREGSESYLTLGIASDRDTLAEAVLGAPAQFHFKTSRGAYFVNVAEADLAAGAITVQVIRFSGITRGARDGASSFAT